MLLVGVAPECKGAPRCCTAREVDSRWTTTAHQTKGELAPQAWQSTHQTRTTPAFSQNGPLLPLPWPLPPLLSAAALAPPSLAQMLLDTLKWRSEYRPEALDYEAIKVGCNVASSS